MKKLLRKWLLKDLVKENAVQWQVIWDLKSIILTLQKEGQDIILKEINFPNKKFFNSFEDGMRGTKILAGYTKGDEKVIFSEILEKGLTEDEVLKKWVNIKDNNK